MANPAFVNPRLTPAQAEALAATFRPSWELDEPAFSPDATLSDADIARLHANTNNGAVAVVQNGRHVSEPHLPPSPRQASEPEDSVIIDRSITANDLSRTAPLGSPAIVVPGAHAQAPAFPAPVSPSAPPPPAPAPGSGRMPVAATAPAYAPPRAAPAYAPAARAVPMQRPAMDDDLAPPRSRKGLFIGLGAVGLVVILGIAFAATRGGDEKAPAPTATAQKPDPTKDIPPPAAMTTTPAAATTTPVAATTSKPEPPPKPDPPAKPEKPQRPVAAQPTGNADPPPAPKPPPPKPPPQRPTVPVKDVPF